MERDLAEKLDASGNLIEQVASQTNECVQAIKELVQITASTMEEQKTENEKRNKLNEIWTEMCYTISKINEMEQARSQVYDQKLQEFQAEMEARQVRMDAMMKRAVEDGYWEWKKAEEENKLDEWQKNIINSFLQGPTRDNVSSDPLKQITCNSIAKQLDSLNDSDEDILLSCELNNNLM